MLILKPATEERVVRKVRAGTFGSEDDVVRAGLDLLEALERDRSDVQRAVAEAQEQLDRGEFVSADESRRRTSALLDSLRPEK
jgi:Arc/MetJ-type ribon-helix-helix transcriptional regulator